MQFIKSLFYTTKTIVQAKGHKMVLVVRTDIPMGKGKTAAQCAHAALECYRQASSDKTKRLVFDAWLRLGQPKIVLRISSEEAVMSLSEKTQSAGLITAVIRDAGRTQLRPGTITAVGIGPAPSEIIDQYTSHLKLL